MPADEEVVAACIVFPLTQSDGVWERSIDAPARGIAATLTEMWESPPMRYERRNVRLLMSALEVLELVVTEYGGSVRVNGQAASDVPAAQARARELLDGWVDEGL